MTDLNDLNVIGRLTKDSLLAYTTQGMAILSLTIAVNRDRKTNDGTIQETSFFDVELRGKIAESLSHYLKKGKQVAINGSLVQNRWKNENGETRAKIKIIANSCQMLGAKPQESTQPQFTPQEEIQSQQSNSFDDEIPFF